MIDVLIIGAGFGGIAMARELDRLGIVDYLIVEKADRVGGTWRDNTYPGAACDVPSHLYSLSFAPNPFWSRLFPRQAEIHSHMQHLSAPWLARNKFRFDWSVASLRWQSAERVWQVSNTRGEIIEARIVVAAMGGLHVPNWPDILGRETFSGRHCHTARWDHSIAFAGKRVGVIGTGTSAIQVVPELAKVAAQLHVFQRTPVWVLPRPDVAIAAWLQRLFAWAPPLRLAFRAALYLQLEMLSLTLLKPRSAFWVRWLARRHLHQQVADTTCRKALQPDYPIGCKRIALSSDYYPALQQANVHLDTTAIAAIEPEGLRLVDDRHVALDVLIYATGFRPMDVLATVQIEGEGSASLNRLWADRPCSANGVAVPGFPNLFFVLGPNTALGHNSVLYMIESQTGHIGTLLRDMRRRRCAEVEAESAAMTRFMIDIDRAFPGTAWAGGCKSWYLDAKGRNIALWVGLTLTYRWRLRRARRRDYAFR
ncbi:MAG TPA: NAD(P)/FAD-dependent oxidoreductase [Pseudomonadota bacterium]|nr:NAD(P)/FAD-dependent oxidoreductase [Xanthomonadales bacterium]HQW80551.1 NAD(P)/FAD-dependent oxidoreductase [Pseudomonadota bacterium]